MSRRLKIFVVLAMLGALAVLLRGIANFWILFILLELVDRAAAR